MIQMQTRLDVADNSGAKKVMCITFNAARDLMALVGRGEPGMCHSLLWRFNSGSKA